MRAMDHKKDRALYRDNGGQTIIETVLVLTLLCYRAFRHSGIFEGVVPEELP